MVLNNKYWALEYKFDFQIVGRRNGDRYQTKKDIGQWIRVLGILMVVVICQLIQKL